MDTLINFSGGIDSTHCLHKYLTQNPRKTLVVHYVNLHARRSPYEEAAVDNILDWHKERGHSNFRLEKTGLDQGTLPRTMDTYVLMFMVGLLLRRRKYRGIKYMLVGAPWDEEERLGREELERRRARGEKTRVSVFGETSQELAFRSDVEMIYPLYGKTKKQIIRELPDELMNLVWYCRRPLNDGVVCGRCHTCRQVHR